MDSKMFLILKSLESVKELAEVVEGLSNPKVSRARLRVLKRKARIIKEHMPRISGDISSALRQRRRFRIDKEFLEEGFEGKEKE